MARMIEGFAGDLSFFLRERSAAATPCPLGARDHLTSVDRALERGSGSVARGGTRHAFAELLEKALAYNFCQRARI
jgi:hypothetical protein